MKALITISGFIGMTLILGSTACGQSERSLVREGNRSYQEKKFTDAEVSYRKALEKNRDLYEGLFNLGDALYKQDRFAEAAEQYLTTASKPGENLTKAQAYHNLGNALLKDQKLPESIIAYKNALKLNPNDLDTKYNLEYAKSLLKQQQNQQQNRQQNRQQNGQNKDSQQKQSQGKQDQQKQDEQQHNQQQEQTKQKDQGQRQAQQKKQQLSKEDAERILEALKNEEKEVQKKLQKKVPARVKVEKDW